MPLNLQFGLIIDSPIEGVDSVNVGPYNLDDASIVGDNRQKSVTLSSSKWETLDADGITPYGWVFINLDTLLDIKIGFGTGEPILIPAGKPAIWWGSTIPRAKAVSGTPRLKYIVFAQT